MYTLYASQTETWLYVEPKVVYQNPGEYLLKVEGELRTPTVLLDFYTPTPEIQLAPSEVEILEQVRPGSSKLTFWESPHQAALEDLTNFSIKQKVAVCSRRHIPLTEMDPGMPNKLAVIDVPLMCAESGDTQKAHGIVYEYDV
jgi:hypothetical protein